MEIEGIQGVNLTPPATKSFRINREEDNMGLGGCSANTQTKNFEKFWWKHTHATDFVRIISEEDNLILDKIK